MMPEVTARATGQSPRWRWTAPCVVLVLLAILAIYRSTAAAMVEIWLRSETFAHGFLVPPIAAWLVWRQRASLARLSPRPCAWLLLPLALCGLAWLLGELAAVGVVTQYAMVAMLVLAVPAIIGWEATKVIIFPLAFLFLAVPFGEFALPVLMDWTASVTVLALRLSGIPVFKEGLQFVIPSGSWSVIEACSGIRYIIASLTVGTLFAYLNYRSLKRRLIFVGVSLIVPVIANWARAYMIVMLGHLSGNTLATGVDHLIYGWLFFGLVIFLTFAVGARWADVDGSSDASRFAASPTVAAPLPKSTPLADACAMLLVIVVVGAAPMMFVGIQHGVSSQRPVLGTLVPAAGWQVADDDQSLGWQPAFSNPSAEQNVVLVSGEQRVGLYVGYYRQQNYQRKLVSSENVLVQSKDPVWASVASWDTTMGFAGHPVRMRAAELRAGSAQAEIRRLSAYQLYWINGYLTASDVVAKLMLAVEQIAGRGDDAAVIVVYAPKTSDERDNPALAAFVAANSERILAQLNAVRDKR